MSSARRNVFSYLTIYFAARHPSEINANWLGVMRCVCPFTRHLHCHRYCCCFAFHLRNINTAEEILSSPFGSASTWVSRRARGEAPYKWDEEWWTWMVCAHMAISNTHIGSRYTRRQQYIYVVSRILPFHLCTETRLRAPKDVYVRKTGGHHHIHTHLLHGRARVQCTYTYFAYINSNISRACECFSADKRFSFLNGWILVWSAEYLLLSAK